MRIKDIHIDGFGVHNERSLRDLSPKLNVIYGKNEDGKTTIKNFVNTILFGFKTRSDVRRHEPLNGGKHGGSLTMEDGEKEVVITRNLANGRSNSEPVIVSPHGDSIKLDTLLKGISEKVYENIFSFGLEELNKLGSLTSKEVMDYIYTAGLGLNNSSLKNARKELKDEMDEIWKQKGKKGLNEDVEKLKKITSDKLEVQSLEKTYVELLERVDDLVNRQSLLEQQRKSCQNKILELERLLKGLPIYNELKAIEKTIGECHVDGSFSPEDKSQLLNLNARYEDLTLEITVLDQEIKDTVQQISLLELNEEVLNYEDEINHLHMDIPLQRENLKTYNENLNQLEKINTKIAMAMDKLDGILTKDVSNIKIPMGVVELLQDSQQVHSEKKGEMEILSREIGIIDLELKDMETESEFLSGSSCSQMLDTLRSLKSEFIKKAKTSQLPLTLLIIILLATVFVGWMGYPLWIMAIMSIGGLALTFFYIFNTYIIPQKTSKAFKKSLKKMGFKDEIDISNIDMIIKQLELEKETKINLQKEALKLNARKDEKKGLIEKYQEFIDELVFEKEVLLDQMGLKKDISQTVAISSIRLMEDIKELHSERDKLSEKLKDQEKKKDNFISQCQMLFENLGIRRAHIKDFEDTITSLKMISNDLKLEIDKTIKLTQLNDSISKMNQGLQSLEVRRKEIKKGVYDFLGKGKVETLEEYCEQYSIYERGEGLRRQRENCVSKLETIFHNLSLLESYQDLTEVQIQQGLQSLEIELTEINSQIEKNNVEKGKLSQEIDIIEKTNSVEELTYEETYLKDRIKNETIRWCTNKLALSILEIAVKEYEDKYQPEVFKRAEKYFDFMTDGRYKRVKLQGETQEIVVLDNRGREIGSQFLSRGTQEQLYICVRLGLMEEFCEKKGKLPVLFDDVFVNFDEERTSKAIEVLLEFSKHNQVLFFTCHKRILDILEQTGNNTINIINLA